MKGKVLKNYDSPINDLVYKVGEIVEINELDTFENSYVIYHISDGSKSIDCIPKSFIEII